LDVDEDTERKAKLKRGYTLKLLWPNSFP